MKTFVEVYDRITSGEQIPENELDDYMEAALAVDTYNIILMIQHQKLTKCLITRYSNSWNAWGQDNSDYYYRTLLCNANEHNAKIINEVLEKIQIFK